MSTATSIADCGYACIAEILRHYKMASPIYAIKSFVGSTERGLTLTQLQTAFGKVGASSVVIAFDRERPDAFPCPGVVLQKRGHYVSLVRRQGERFRVFDPATGWQTIHFKHLGLDPIALGIEVTDVKTRVIPVSTSNLEFLSIAGRYARSRLGVRVLLLGLLAQALLLTIPLFTQHTIDTLGPGLGSSSLYNLALAFILITTIGSISSVIALIGDKVVANRMSLTLAGELFDRLIFKGVDWFQSHPSGHIYTQYQALVALQQFYGNVIARLFSAILIGVVGLAAMFFVSPWLVVPGLVGMALSSLIDWLFRDVQQTNSARSIQVQTKQRAFFYDVMNQLPMLLRTGSLAQSRSQLRRHVWRVADSQLTTARLNASRGSVISLLSTFEQLVFVCLAGYFVKTENLSLGVFVAAGLYKDQFAHSLKALFQIWNQHKLLAPQEEQLAELMAEKTPRSGPEGTVAAGHVRVDNVSFRYGTLDDWVLNQLTFHVNAGECVALNGKSGAGKTTLIKLICGESISTAGEILIDGDPVGQGIKKLGAVFQTDRLITDTLRENILVFRKSYSDDEVYEALEVVGMAQFVKALPMQLSTGIGEGMTGLSGGQRQRILLARALLGGPKLLILDEATSNLDVDSESQIIRNIQALSITIIVCSHRPDVWRFADRIYEMANGSVREITSPNPESTARA